MFSGDDKNPGSGRLELRYHDGSESYVDEGFLCATLTLDPTRLRKLAARLKLLAQHKLPPVLGVSVRLCILAFCATELKLAQVLACSVPAFARALVCQACSGPACVARAQDGEHGAGRQRPGVHAALHQGLPRPALQQRRRPRSRLAGKTHDDCRHLGCILPRECQQDSCEQAVRVLEAMYRSAASGKTELAK